MYASSSAVYNASDPSPAPETGGTSPSTLYGVSKLADEGIARVYRADAGVSSIGLRPYVVYGLGRDQGMTSGPTAAMLAAARGEASTSGSPAWRSTTTPPTSRGRRSRPRTRRAGGSRRLQHAGRRRRRRRHRRRDPRSACPDAEITWSGDPLPFPAELEAVGFDRDVGPFPRTPLADGRGGDDRARSGSSSPTTG